MKFFFKKIIILSIIFICLPIELNAEEENLYCNTNGYSIITINGVFTNEKQARENKDNLKNRFSKTHNNEPVYFDFLHNPSHLAGFGDVVKSAYQGLFDDETIWDYDLTEMIKDASQKVTTQKVLIVAHSQGNFYANNFYDVVAGNVGGIPKQSIGVYAVATPSSKTSGNGLWLTSSTDKIISGIVAGTLSRKIMPPNINIKLKSGDDTNGHSFSDVYLKYAGARIASDIERSLHNLKNNDIQKNEEACINPPKISIVHRTEGVLFAMADPVANVGRGTIAMSYNISNKTLELGGKLVAFGINTTVSTAIFAGRMVVKAGAITYDAGKLVAGTVYSLATIVFDDKEEAPKIVVLQDKKELDKPIIKNKVTNKTQKKILTKKEEKQEILVENKTEEKVEAQEENVAPRVIKLTPINPGFGGGSVKGIVEEQSLAASIGNVFNKQIETISIPQCLSSLSKTGCLLATTTVNISWTPVSTATQYVYSINGIMATTTLTNLSLQLSDFQEYLFELKPIDQNNEIGSSTSASFSLATIPLAINEIAFLGTKSNENDEWIELKNNTNHTLDLSGWAIELSNIENLITLSGEIAPKGYVIVTRGTNSVSIKNEANLVTGNAESQNILSNTGESIVLHRNNESFDSTPVLKGDSFGLASTTNKESVERRSSKSVGSDILNWGLNLGSIKNGTDANGLAIEGTPGEHNSLSYLINRGESKIYQDITLEQEEGPYAIFETIYVSATSTLTIEPGTVVYFTKNNSLEGSLNVNGRIIAGGEGPAVHFDSYNGNMAGYIVIRSSSATSTFNNVVINNVFGFEITGINAKAEITNSTFTNNNEGVNIYGGADVIIHNVLFASTTHEAISAYTGSSMLVSSSTIINNLKSDAIGIYNSSLTISSSTISNVASDGISFYNSTNNKVENVKIENIDGSGIGVYSSDVHVQDTLINNVSDSGIYLAKSSALIENVSISDFNSNSAIYVSKPSYEVIVKDSLINGNSNTIITTDPSRLTLINNTFCDGINACITQ